MAIATQITHFFTNTLPAGFSAVFKKIRDEDFDHLPIAYDPSFKMLLIGETGSGKTSLINLFCNCALIENLGDKMPLNNIREFHDIELEDSESKKMQSKTTGAKEYSTMLGKLELGIIDTPGFGDTRGLDKDSENVKKIIQTLQDTNHINCVCVVINGRNARLNTSIKYVLTEITTILPNEIVNNLIVVFSNTNDELESNFDIEELSRYISHKISQDRIFYIENPCCKLDKAKTKQALSSDTIQSLARSFNITAKVLQRMNTVIKNFKPVHTFHFISLYRKKEEIEKKVTTILAKFDQQRELDERIKTQQEEITAALKQKKLYSDYKTTQKFTRRITIETDRHNTLCKAPHCFSNCHVPCYLEKAIDYEPLRKCASIKDGYCKKCGHHYTKHYHGEMIFETEECVEELINPEMKEQFEKSSDMEEKAKMLMKQSQKRKKESEKEKERLSKELLIVLDEFHGKSLHRNYVKVLQMQIDVIKLRIKDVNALETASLQKTLEELEERFKLIQHTLEKEPWSKTDEKKTREWACLCLGLDSKGSLTAERIKKAFKQVSKTYHPDKGGDDDHFKRIQQAKDLLLRQHLN